MQVCQGPHSEVPARSLGLYSNQQACLTEQRSTEPFRVDSFWPAAHEDGASGSGPWVSERQLEAECMRYCNTLYPNYVMTEVALELRCLGPFIGMLQVPSSTLHEQQLTRESFPSLHYVDVYKY